MRLNEKPQGTRLRLNTSYRSNDLSRYYTIRRRVQELDGGYSAGFHGYVPPFKVRWTEFITGEMPRQGTIRHCETPKGSKQSPRRGWSLLRRLRLLAMTGLNYLPLALKHRLVRRNSVYRKNGQVESRRFVEHQFGGVPPHRVTLLKSVT